MNRLSSLGVLGALALAITAESGVAWASTFQQTIHVDPAPPLTPAQIDRLKHVTSWDLEFTELSKRDSAGSGDVGQFGVPAPWSHERNQELAFHFRTPIAGKLGQSDCNIGNPNRCIVQYNSDGKVEVSIDHFHLRDTELFPTCSPLDPTPNPTLTVNDVDGPAVSYVPDGAPGKSSFGFMEIDYAENPPLVYSSINFDGSIRHSISHFEDCHGSSTFEGDPLRDLDAGWSTGPGVCCTEGDIQVRIEHGAFVVHGISNEIRTGLECLRAGSPGCMDPNNRVAAPFTDTHHQEWVLREHDCQDTNGNGNSDDDEDGLCDNWEKDGLDVDGDGTIDLPLNKPPYSADPEHKDLFVEIDYMDDPGNNHTEKPSDDALYMVKNAFAFAPVSNPDGLRGVRLHFVGSEAANPDPRKLVDEAVPHSARINFKEDFTIACPSRSFDDLKSKNFGTAAERADMNAANILEAKSRVFRYAVFAHQQIGTDDGSGGCKETTSSGTSELPGNDLIVTVGGWSYPSPTQYSGGGPKDCFIGEAPVACARRHVDAATFMHEFGHTLGLHHGGADDTNCKPNYLSVMNYSFQNRSLVSTRPLDYSGGVAGGFDDDPFAPLDERNLDEPAGIAGPLARNGVYGVNGRTAYLTLNLPIDWNLDPDGRTDETGVMGDIARLDVKSACARGTSADVQNVTVKFGVTLDTTSVPAPTDFGVHLNGGPAITPAAVAVTSDRVYLTLAAPVGIADKATLDYVIPSVSPITHADGTLEGAFNGFEVPNVTGNLKTLFARDDWATLQYDMRLAPAFDDGATRDTVPTDEVTEEESLAGAELVDFDGDGLSNAADNCPATYNPTQDDADADGIGDDCAPTLAADHEDPTSMGVASPSTNPFGWNNTDVTVNLTAADDPNGSGVREIDYVMNGAQSEAQQSVAGDTASPIVSMEGETALKFFAVDNFGNPELPNTVMVRLDKTAPAITAAQDPPPNANGWNSSDVTVSFTCGDTLSGVATCDAPAVIISEGAGLSLTGSTADLAGNAAQVTVSGINIDRTSPGVKCSVTPSVLWPPKHKLIPIKATVNVTDALSGTSGFTLTSVTSSEPDSVKKKDKPGDIAGFAVGTPATTGQLRAERIAKGPGRVYNLTWTGQDAAGNAASCSATVTVPKKKPKVR